jgi:hypothetical protein
MKKAGSDRAARLFFVHFFFLSNAGFGFTGLASVPPG